MDVTKTEFKVVAMYDGWEYVILSHELGTLVEPEDRKLFVTVRQYPDHILTMQYCAVMPSLHHWCLFHCKGNS
jgi:hypothetical protein